jgi:hypothetical protein
MSIQIRVRIRIGIHILALVNDLSLRNLAHSPQDIALFIEKQHFIFSRIQHPMIGTMK